MKNVTLELEGNEDNLAPRRICPVMMRMMLNPCECTLNGTNGTAVYPDEDLGDPSNLAESDIQNLMAKVLGLDDEDTPPNNGVNTNGVAKHMATQTEDVDKNTEAAKEADKSEPNLE